jgi:hypothetical protein
MQLIFDTILFDQIGRNNVGTSINASPTKLLSDLKSQDYDGLELSTGKMEVSPLRK